jgi:hypothetical protein
MTAMLMTLFPLPAMYLVVARLTLGFEAEDAPEAAPLPAE